MVRRASPQRVTVLFLGIWLTLASSLQDLPNCCGSRMLRKPFCKRELLPIPQVVQSSICKNQSPLLLRQISSEPEQLRDQCWSFTWPLDPQWNMKKSAHPQKIGWNNLLAIFLLCQPTECLQISPDTRHRPIMIYISDRNCPKGFGIKALKVDPKWKAPQPDFPSVQPNVFPSLLPANFEHKWPDAILVPWFIAQVGGGR